MERAMSSVRSEQREYHEKTVRVMENMGASQQASAVSGAVTELEGMLKVVRSEYESMRKERDVMRVEMEKERKEREALGLRVNEMESELLSVREAKRRTIKNLVDENNEMREQVRRLGKRQKEEMGR